AASQQIQRMARSLVPQNRPFPPNATEINDERAVIPPVPQGGGGHERALFRFSTETLLPAWLPVPALSFEVVRRPPLGAQPATQQQPQERAQTEPTPVRPSSEDVQGAGNVDRTQIPFVGHRDEVAAPETSFLRRLLVLAGAMPMSAEEEAAALAHLVDMFPQYDRSDLLRELRDRGTTEAVVEAVLVGVFSGVPRGD
ncbi:MAG: hypothetical protein SGILL_002893, partial [Bacillariaceae sp.]